MDAQPSLQDAKPSEDALNRLRISEEKYRVRVRAVVSAVVESSRSLEISEILQKRRFTESEIRVVAKQIFGPRTPSEDELRRFGEFVESHRRTIAESVAQRGVAGRTASKDIPAPTLLGTESEPIEDLWAESEDEGWSESPAAGGKSDTSVDGSGEKQRKTEEIQESIVALSG